MNHNLKNFPFKNLSGTNLKTLQNDTDSETVKLTDRLRPNRLTLLSCSQTASSGESVYNSN